MTSREKFSCLNQYFEERLIMIKVSGSQTSNAKIKDVGFVLFSFRVRQTQIP